jgi:NAD+ synthase (glutamine-hydrolysing)
MKAVPLIAAAALNQTPLDWQGNFERIAKAITIAKKQHADFLVLPELCISGYGCEDWFNSDFVLDTSWKMLLKLIPLCTDICVAISLPYFDINTSKTYNACAIITDGRLAHIQLKKFLAVGSVYYEPRWFHQRENYSFETILRGEQTFTVGHNIVAYKEWKVGIEICEDAWQDTFNRPSYSHFKKGADVLLIPNGSHFEFGKWLTRNQIVRESAILGMHTAYVNILGNESGTLIFDGDCIFGEANSEVVKSHPRFSYQDVVVHFSNEPHNADHIISKEEEFVQATTLGLFDFARKAKVRGYVLSLSGGADSATCAVLIAEMLKRAIKEIGNDAVAKAFGFDVKFIEAPSRGAYSYFIKRILFCAYQATENSSQTTTHAAKVLAEDIGCTYYHWEIDKVLNEYTATIEKATDTTITWENHDLTLQNIQARSRSPIIWMLANMNNCLLLTTSNRSEGAVGYATMDGDMSGSLAPIAGVSKQFIKEFLVYAQDTLGYSSLKYIIEQKPTAELRPLSANQFDEKDLMPYSILEEIEYLMVYQKHSPDRVLHELSILHPDIDTQMLLSYTTKYFQLWSRNQWKRERMAPSFHLDSFSVNPRSWCRFPILSSGFTEELQALKSDSLAN